MQFNRDSTNLINPLIHSMFKHFFSAPSISIYNRSILQPSNISARSFTPTAGIPSLCPFVERLTWNDHDSAVGLAMDRLAGPDYNAFFNHVMLA